VEVPQDARLVATSSVQLEYGLHTLADTVTGLECPLQQERDGVHRVKDGGEPGGDVLAKMSGPQVLYMNHIEMLLGQ